MRKWQGNLKTTPRKVTPLEKILQNNSVSTAVETEEQARQQIGQLLTQCSYFLHFATSLEQVVQSNLATPVMEEATSFALWVMANHLTNTCDQLKTSICTWHPYETITPNEHALWDGIDDCQALIDEVMYALFGLSLD